MAKKSQMDSEAKVDEGAPAAVQGPVRSTLWLLAAGAWVLVVLALVSYDPADWPGATVAPRNAQVHNWIGPAGALLAHKMYLVVGPGVWLMLAGVAVGLATWTLRRPITQPVLRAIGVVIMGLAMSALCGVWMPDLAPGLSDRPEGAGGLIAIVIDHQLTVRFGALGAVIIVVVGFWVGAVLAVDRLVMMLPHALGVAALATGRMIGRRFPSLPLPWLPRPVTVGGGDYRREEGEGEAAGLLKLPPGALGRGQIAIGNRGRKGKVEDAIDEEAGGLGAVEPFNPDEHRADEMDDAVATAELDEDDEDKVIVGEVDEDDDTRDASNDSGADAPGAYIAEKRQFTTEELRAKIKQLPINFAPPSAGGKKPHDLPREIDLSGYQFPGLDLLAEPESNFTAEMEKIVRDQAVLLESALQQYRIEGEVVGIDSGPVITLYEVRLAPGTKVSALSAVASDLARALKAQNVRIVPNMAGKDTVGIEVPNIIKERVRLKELMTTDPAGIQKMALPMFLGKDASGNGLIADLSAMPHMLIAGTTGSGKSVCMNSIIMSFLFTKRPDELKLVLVDPKMVEMSLFKDIPHLMCPVVTEMAKAAAILEWATTKMDERYELLAEAGVRDIAGYNALPPEELKARFNPANEEEEARIPKKLPYLVFIIDELADLIITNKEVEGFIVRLAQKARAVGLHLILATQRPQANVVTGLIKSNMPCRVSFKVASGMDSRIVLDQKGAELLLGQGDMLYLSPRTSKLTRAQGTLVDDVEIRKAVQFLKTISQQNFEPQLVQLKSSEMSEEDLSERDPLFDDAVRVVLQTKRGSVSLLQRRLTIGYSRASRLIEQMAQAGIIGEYKGSQAREVTMTVEEYEAIKAQAEADAVAAEASGAPATAAQGDADTADDDDAVPDEMDNEYKQ